MRKIEGKLPEKARLLRSLNGYKSFVHNDKPPNIVMKQKFHGNHKSRHVNLFLKGEKRTTLYTIHLKFKFY